MKLKIILTLLILSTAAVVNFAQTVVKPNQDQQFSLKPGESKTFTLDLEKDGFAEIKIGGSEENYVEYAVISPDGFNLTESAPQSEDSFPFVAAESGAYQIKVSRGNDEENKTAVKYTFIYNDKFVLPAGLKVKDSRKINGYDAKIYEDGEEFGNTFLQIEKGGKLKYIAKGTKTVGGLDFPDNPTANDDQVEKKSAALFASTADKTGDGAPDLAVNYFSGGAHCCFSMYFFELGDEFKIIPALNTGDANTVAIGKMPDGSLKLATGDATFAYWNTSFAGSPIPEVILSFRDGAFRADAKLMAKPAPPLAKLKANAAAVNRKMSLAPYTGTTDDNTFDEAVWGEMLDLIYSGHEDLAYQYLDWAWNPRKKGREKFKSDFQAQLAKSDFYQDYLTSKK